MVAEIFGFAWRPRSSTICLSRPAQSWTSTARFAWFQPSSGPAGAISHTNDEDRFHDGGFTSLSLDFRAGRIDLCPKMVGREGEQPKVIVVRPMAMGWTRAAIAGLPEIVDRLLDILERGTVSVTVGGRS